MLKIPCPVCEGKGYITWINATETSVGTKTETCPHCQGTGQREVPFTNADCIRAMTDEELAKNNVHQTYEYTVDYDCNDNPVGEYTPCWKTSDGTIYWDEEAAIEWEMKWLKLPCGGADQ